MDEPGAGLQGDLAGIRARLASGPLFNPSAFNPEDVSAALFEKGAAPLPDIEATRDQWPILSWATKPG